MGGGGQGPTAGPAGDGRGVDRHVGTRIRRRRTMVGLTQHRLAELVGVSCRQAHRYEKGVERVPPGRLLAVAAALGVEVAYFHEGLGAGPAPPGDG
jgi:transcriptional regulator with XRE-family HTH domain